MNSTLTLLFVLIFLTFGKSHSKKVVCVLGAGRSGLNSIKHLADYPNEFQPVAFEKRSDVGGVWIYSDNVDSNVCSPMYKHVRAVEPKEIMTCPDYREFHGEDRSCPSHESVLDYLKNYTEHFHVRQYIKFNTIVEKITPILMSGDYSSTQWLFEIRKLETNSSEKIICDAAMISSGRFSKPKIPEIPGINRFPGRTIHSSEYRKPEDFTNQTVVVLGAGLSGIEISLDLSKHAKTVYLSHRHEKLQYEMPANIKQIAGVVGAKNNEFILQDGSQILANSLILCTGYKTDFSFLDTSINVQTLNGYLYPLYKAMVHIEHPSMAFIGFDPLGRAFCPPLYTQASYYVSVLRGKVKLPSRNEMLKIANSTLSIKPMDQDKFKWKIWNEMAEEGQFEPIPDFYEKAQSVWDENKKMTEPYFRDYNLFINDDGKFIIEKIKEE